MTPEEAIKSVHIRSRGRTRYVGKEPYLDEILVDEILRLQLIEQQLKTENQELKDEIESLSQSIAGESI